MKGEICGINWVTAEAMKYWSFPASYTQEKRKQEVNEAIFNKGFLGTRKVDGYYQRIVKDDWGNCFMIARSKNVNGEPVNKIEWVPHLNPFFEALPNGTVLLCECYLPGKEGSKNVTSLLGCLKDKCIERQKNDKLHLYIFDVCAYNKENLIDTKAKDRFELLKSLSQMYNFDYVNFAIYYTGKELWNQLQAYLADGYEGVVITDPDCTIYFKRTPAHKTIKIKKELKETIDVIITGGIAPTRLYGGKDIENWSYWENVRTGEKINQKIYKQYSDGLTVEPVTKAYFHNWAGSLSIGLYNPETNKVENIGSVSGLPEEVLSNWQVYRGSILEISGMEIMYDSEHNFSGIRHPKPICFRSDKSLKDCSISQVIEK